MLKTEFNGRGLADIHIHTRISDGMADIQEVVDFVEHETNLDVISITDHDRIEGGYQARELVAQRNYRFEVVLGMEVSTRDGHVLALFIESPVPSFQPLAKTIECIHAQGGLCVVSHPMCWLTHSIGQRSLDRTMSEPDERRRFDGIELVNSALAEKVCYHKLKRLNDERYHIAETGGSDAHFLPTVGSGYTLFEGRKAADLKRSLIKGTTEAASGAPVRLSKVGYNRVVTQVLRGLVVLPVRSVFRLVGSIVEGRGR